MESYRIRPLTEFGRKGLVCEGKFPHPCNGPVAYAYIGSVTQKIGKPLCYACKMEQDVREGKKD